MNVPVGTGLIQGKKLSLTSVARDISEFMTQSKTGYVCVTTKGKNGLEEGLLIIETGLVIGSHYEYLNFDKSFSAKEALKRTLNAFLSDKGIYDSYTLTVQQIELLKIFNEDMLFLQPIDSTAFQGALPVEFTQQFEDELAQAGERTRTDILSEHGLSSVEIDSYQRVSEQVQGQFSAPTAASKVEEEVSSYLIGRPPKEEPKEAPTVHEKGLSKKIVLQKPPPPPRTEMDLFEREAEELLKGMEKKKKEKTK